MRPESESNQRSQFRFPVQRRAFVTRGTLTTVCEVHDLTDRGLQFQADAILRIDDAVRMEVQLDGDCIIHCEVLVIHAIPPHFGGRITQMSPEDQQQFAQYIDRLVRSSMWDP
jgi:hypothetical protein